MAPATPAGRATRSTAGRKPKTKTKSQPKKQETSRSKAPAKSATQKEMKEFMENQARINEAILQQLQAIGTQEKDKSGRAIFVTGNGEQGEGSLGRVVGQKTKTSLVEDITLQSSSSESEGNLSDYETLARADMTEANALLKAKFNKTTGRVKNSKRLEKAIISNRPYAFLDRDTQRSLTKDDIHPEELSFSLHVEGLAGMITANCANQRIRAMIDHLHQVIRDGQVHPWPRVRRWSNEVLVKAAINEWQWTDSDKIIQAKNAQYMIGNSGLDSDAIRPCFLYNKGACSSEFTHYEGGQTAAHVCSFCFLIDGSRESHQAKNCGRRRSSANYFKNRDDSAHSAKKDKFKTKGFGGKDLTDRQTKN